MRYFVLLLSLIISIAGFSNPTKKTLVLRITNSETQYLDQTTVYLDYGTTALYNWQEDSKKIFNTSTFIPQIYTLTSDNQQCFTNGFGPFQNTITLKVGFRTDSAGNFRIGASTIDKFDPTTIITLEDKVLGLYHDLRQGNYNFSVNSAQFTDSRFILHLSYPVQITTTAAGCNNDNGIIMLSQDTTVRWSQCLLYDASNTLVGSTNNVTGNFEFQNLPEGNYLLAFAYGAYVATLPKYLPGNAITLNAVSYPTEGYVGQDVMFYTSGENIQDYFWQMGDGTNITSIANPNYSYSDPGSYTVIVTASNSYGCQKSDTLSVSISPATSVTDIAPEGFAVYTSGRSLVVSGLNSADVSYSIYDLTGRLIANEKYNGNNSLLPAQVKGGIYVVAISTPELNLTRKIFVR